MLFPYINSGYYWLIAGDKPCEPVIIVCQIVLPKKLESLIERGKRIVMIEDKIIDLLQKSNEGMDLITLYVNFADKPVGDFLVALISVCQNSVYADKNNIFRIVPDEKI